jgi:aspartate aminotransferase-like enzyme
MNHQLEPIILKAKALHPKHFDSMWIPADVQLVVDTILKEKPKIVFAPHVETSTGLILPDEYLIQVGKA